MIKITKSKYKTNLTMQEITLLNNLKDDYQIFERTKLNMMSVYSYVIKHGADTTIGLKKSLKDLWKMYKRYHSSIKSISNFKKIIYKLEEVKLIFIEKIGKVNVYHARKFLEVADKVTEEVTDKKVSESIDTTNVESNSQNTQILNLNKDYINIINNTSSDVSNDDVKNSLAYKKACETNNADTLAPIELMKIAYKILKEKRRRSEKLISMVRKALMDKMHIARVNAVAYVETVVADKIAKYEFNREMYALTITKNKNNYRAAYNKSRNTNVANFTQRVYDCDALEKQLLGWSDGEYDYV